MIEFRICGASPLPLLIHQLYTSIDAGDKRSQSCIEDYLAGNMLIARDEILYDMSDSPFL